MAVGLESVLASKDIIVDRNPPRQRAAALESQPWTSCGTMLSSETMPRKWPIWLVHCRPWPLPWPQRSRPHPVAHPGTDTRCPPVTDPPSNCSRASWPVGWQGKASDSQQCVRTTDNRNGRHHRRMKDCRQSETRSAKMKNLKATGYPKRWMNYSKFTTNYCSD